MHYNYLVEELGDKGGEQNGGVEAHARQLLGDVVEVLRRDLSEVEGLAGKGPTSVIRHKKKRKCGSGSAWPHREGVATQCKPSYAVWLCRSTV